MLVLVHNSVPFVYCKMHPPTNLRFRDIDVTSIEHLRDVENYWAEKCLLFEAHGYALRPRYRPGWTPSWRGKPIFEILNAEDALSLHVSSNYWTHPCRQILTQLRRESTS